MKLGRNIKEDMYNTLYCFNKTKYYNILFDIFESLVSSYSNYIFYIGIKDAIRQTN